MSRSLLCLGIACLGIPHLASGSPDDIAPRPFRVPARLPDVAELSSPSAVHIDGWLGPRLDANARQRLLQVDTEELLAGFRKKPGSHPWIGEHIGKWMHAATLAWAYTGDPALRAKLDQAAAGLVQAQEPDGYLGTYVPEQRFGLFPQADWDVWSHKYCLVGLLTYAQYTGNEPALGACRKIGDLLIATFPERRSILAAGTHVGMAATSVLEPMVWLYRMTGDSRYLDFARYLVKSWDEPRGPKIIASLLRERSVNKTANRKAYEMMSNLVGLCELARATGDRELLEPVVIAWSDIVANRLYLTGTASAGEHFQEDHSLPNSVDSHVGETCVTTTWIQLNQQLLRLTGEARYADELDRTIYNHLAAAQHPRGDDWCYFTALEGTKKYDKGITCCHSSGPRGMALAPQSCYFKVNDNGRDTLAIGTFEPSRATLTLNGVAVTVEQRSAFPRQGKSTLTLRLPSPARFGVMVRVPAWAAPLAIQVPGEEGLEPAVAGWARIAQRAWKDGDQIALEFPLAARLMVGDHGNAGRLALGWGPFVLAYDQALNPGLPEAVTFSPLPNGPVFTLRDGNPLTFAARVSAAEGEPRLATFVPFADAGATGGRYQVWLRSSATPPAPRSTR